MVTLVRSRPTAMVWTALMILVLTPILVQIGQKWVLRMVLVCRRGMSESKISDGCNGYVAVLRRRSQHHSSPPHHMDGPGYWNSRPPEPYIQIGPAPPTLLLLYN